MRRGSRTPKPPSQAPTRNAGIPVYGVSAIFQDPADERAHGRDERIEIRRFYESLEYWRRLLEALAGPD